MKKVCAMLLILTLVLMPLGTALAAGMPAAHGVSGRDFGRMVSELARSYPGAVADHVKAMRPPEKEDPLRVVLMIQGDMEDPYFANAYNGMEMIEEEFYAVAETILLPEDPDSWSDAIASVSQGDWDIVIVGTWMMIDCLDLIAQEFPDQKYIIFDGVVDQPNVYSIQYKVHESSFLAGALAAMVTVSDLPYANSDNRIGYIGGVNIPVINQFLAGYVAGANHADPDVEVLYDYVGGFDDPDGAKDMALDQFNNGVDIIFAAAGMSGYGVMEAATESEFYGIGVDYDQAESYEDDVNVDSNLILTSVMKNIDQSLVYAVGRHINGTLDYGTAGYLGLAEEAVGIADNEYYQSLPNAMHVAIAEITEEIIDGSIEVPETL